MRPPAIDSRTVHDRLQLREAHRADPVAEQRVGVSRDVLLQLLPTLVVVADLLAVAADRNDAPQLLELTFEMETKLFLRLRELLGRATSLRDVGNEHGHASDVTGIVVQRRAAVLPKTAMQVRVAVFFLHEDVLA